MKVTLEKKEKNHVQLELEVESNQVEAAYERAYREISKHVNIPGFRKGKAPRPLVERHVGVDYIKEEAYKKLLPQVYTNAVEQEKIEPIADPEFELVKDEKDAPLVFKATVEVRPEVKLGAYTGLELTGPKAEVSEEAVNERLEQMRASKSTQVTVDRPVQMDDVALVDFVGKIDGEPFAGGEATDFSLEVTPGRFIEGFVEALVGMKAGEEKAAELKFPEEYHNKELAGKPVVFELKVKEVKAKQLPELDAAFAQDFDAESPEALKARVREELEREAQEARDLDLRRSLLDKLVEGAEMEVPETMVNREVGYLLQQQANQLSQQGIDPNRIFTRENIDKWRESTRPEAEKRIRTSLVLGEVARKEGLSVSDEEVEAALGEYAEAYQMPVSEFRNQVIRSGAYAKIADEVLSNKIIEWLFERAKVTDSEPTAVSA